MKIDSRGYAIIAAALFGASAPFSKLLLGDIPPLQLAGLLYLGSGTVLLLYKFIQIAFLKGGIEANFRLLDSWKKRLYGFQSPDDAGASIL